MSEKIEKYLKKIEELNQQILAVQLYANGCTMDQIAKHLHISKAGVVVMLKGVKQKQYGKI